MKIIIYVLLLHLSIFAQEPKFNLQMEAEGPKLTQKINPEDSKSCILVHSDVQNLQFDSNQQIDKVVNQTGGDWIVWLPPGTHILKIDAPGFKRLELFPFNFQRKKIYDLNVTVAASSKKLDLIPVSIDVDKENVSIFIDNKFSGKGKTHQIAEGKHELRLEKEGYKTISQTIEVNTQNILFRFKMTETDPLLVKIQSTPVGADIYLDNTNIGQTNKDKYIFEGKHSLKLIKSGYLDVQKEIEIKENTANTFSYSLEKTAVLLTLRIIPADAVIYINKENYNNKTTNELPPGRYKIEISKEGYRDYTEVVDLELGKPVTKEYNLQMITGKLQLTVTPPEADVELIRGTTVVKKWQGSTILKDLQVGKYMLSVTNAGYNKLTKEIIVSEDKPAAEEIQLTRGRDLVSGSNMVFVKSGSFMMGSNDNSDEKPVHKVTVGNFYIGKYEVTQKEWQEILGSNPSNIKGDDFPVEKVSWDDVQEYLKKLNSKTGKKYRLPTEAEWEYAARGGNQSSGYKFSGSNNIDEVAWYSSNSGSKTHSVGTKKSNELGIFDMSGNVWEWCSDWYGADYYKNSPEQNPKGASNGDRRLLRGGSWSLYNLYCRVSFRYSNVPDYRNHLIGFRVVEDL